MLSLETSIQLCEWHRGHTSNHLMMLDGVPVAQRRELVARLNGNLWGPRGKKRERYERFVNAALTQSPRTQAMPRDSLNRIQYVAPSSECTTSPAEREMREMREINRRTDVGALWTVRGVNHMC